MLNQILVHSKNVTLKTNKALNNTDVMLIAFTLTWIGASFLPDRHCKVSGGVKSGFLLLSVTQLNYNNLLSMTLHQFSLNAVLLETCTFAIGRISYEYLFE